MVRSTVAISRVSPSLTERGERALSDRAATFVTHLPSDLLDPPTRPSARDAICLLRHRTHENRPCDRHREDETRPGEIQVSHPSPFAAKVRTVVHGAQPSAASRRIAPRARGCTRDVRGACVIAVCACALVTLLGVTARARAAEPESYEVRARVMRDAGEVVIEQTIRARVSAGEREVRLWLYGDRLAVPPRALGERTWRWIYPGDVDAGEVAIDRVEIDGVAARVALERQSGGIRGRDALGADAIVPIEPGSARTVEIRLAVRMRVPARFGRVGRDGSTLSLAGPWYPLVIGEGDAWRYIARHTVSIEADGGEIVLGGTVSGPRAEVVRDTTYVPALLAPRIDLWQGIVAGVPVAWASFEAIYREPEDDLGDPLQIDRLALLRRVLEPVITTARWLGIELPPRIDLLMIPSRTELVATAPGAVLVSDRWAQVFPIDAVRDFHLRALRRALFARLCEPIVDRIEPPADRGWAEDLRAIVLLELDELRRTSHVQTPEQLLSAFAFHPAVDALLYAPQIAFESVYFAAIDEPDAFRDDPARSRVPYARGRRILESARDVLDERELARLIATLARGRRSVREALARIDRSALERLPLWLDYPQLEVNYRLGAITSEPITREGGAPGWRHVVEVIREGAHRPEPVEVEVEDASGARTRAVWDGTGGRGEVVIETARERRSVTIDPRHRLPQSAAIADGHPRRDDATDHAWRPPIFTGFTFDVLGSEGNVTGLIDVVLRQQYDLEHTFALRLVRTASRTGGRFRYFEGVGPKVHTNRRAATIGGGLGFYYVHPGFGGSTLGGYAIDVDLQLTIDTRSYLYDWREGMSLVWSMEVRTTVREDGTFGASGRALVRASRTWAIGNLHAIVLVGHAGVTVNPVLEADRQSMGGRYGLRGFANDELLGTSVLYAVAEHRFTAVTDLAWNVFHGLWARELQLAWWLGAGVVLGHSDGRDAVFAGEVGLGLRVHYEYAGIQPGVLAIDFGLPVTRWIERTPCSFQASSGCDGRVPFGFYVSVDQYY
jgi:hypothetical protein